jgi:hypothetical protein
MLCAIVVFLRIIVSGTEHTEDGEIQPLFSESLLLRMSSATIGGFVGGVYEILLNGFTLTSVLFGVSMVLIPPIACFGLSGIFDSDFSFRSIMYENTPIFSLKGKEQDEKYKIIFFQVSALLLAFLAGYSLRNYELLGIDFSYIFVGVLTIFTSKRFGALRGATVGFISALGLSSSYSVAFALAGILLGAVFKMGTAYALVGGGVAVGMWSAYSGGVSLFVGILPEYVIAAVLSLPVLKRTQCERRESESVTLGTTAKDMVGTMALAYRNRQTFFAESAERAVAELAPKIDGFCNDSGVFDAYLAFARMLSEAKEKTLNKRELDESLTDRIEPVFRNFGFDGGIIRAFGDRMKYIICSGCDTDGTLITSPALKAELEEACGIKLSAPEYYRRDDMVLMECEAAAKYKLEGAFACESRSNDEISGDSIKLFISKELFAYGLICDGMGSGAEARKAADFSSSFLEIALKNGIGEATALHMLNAALRNGDEECSVAADMFVLDLLSCEAKFIKSGGACSYVKRGASLFRIKSETMPLGLLRRVDAEQITASVTMGDYIIMLSDGACDPASDSVWLVELLNGEPEPRLDAYAERILSAARKNRRTADDMSVLVMKAESVA